MRNVLCKTLLIAAAVWSVVLLPTEALAQNASLSCSGGSPGGGQLYDTGGPGVTNKGFCEFTGIQHIFSNIICNFILVINNVMEKVYCSMLDALKEIVGAIITLYIAVFGTRLAMGTAQATAREFLTHLFKIALVWTFITDSTWGIDIAFKFFITIASEGVVWVLQAIPISTSAAAACHDSAAGGAADFMKAFVKIDELICNAIYQQFTTANGKVMGFFLVIAFLIPQVSYLAFKGLWMMFKVMLNALITFLLGIAAIAFLITLSPIFISLVFFQVTYRFFETWLKYLISFTLQIIIVFACIALWMLSILYMVDFFNMLSNTVFPFKQVEIASAIQNPSNNIGVCPYNFSPTPTGTGTGVKTGPEVKCKTWPFDPINVEGDHQKVIPLSAMLMAKGGADNHTQYIYFVIYYLIAMIIICYAFEALLRQAPMIAVYLAGPDYAPIMGQGIGVDRLGRLRLTSPGSSVSAFGFDRQTPFSSIAERPQASGEASKQFREQSQSQVQPK